MKWRLQRAHDWLRFRGWRNAYWREDGNHARCPHDVPPWVLGGSNEPFYIICPECGAGAASSSWCSCSYTSRGDWHP